MNLITILDLYTYIFENLIDFFSKTTHLFLAVHPNWYINTDILKLLRIYSLYDRKNPKIVFTAICSGIKPQRDNNVWDSLIVSLLVIINKLPHKNNETVSTIFFNKNRLHQQNSDRGIDRKLAIKQSTKKVTWI